MSTHPLRKLLRTSLARSTNKKLFVSLLEQLLAREPISDAQLSETLLELTEGPSKNGTIVGRSSEKLHMEYAMEYAFSSSENLAKVLRLLPLLSYPCQHRYVGYFKAQLSHILRRPLREEFQESLAQYTLALDAESAFVSGKITPDSKRLWYNVVFLWGELVDQDASLPSRPRLREALLGIFNAARVSGDPHIEAYVSRKIWSSTDPPLVSHIQQQHVLKSETTISNKPSKSLSLNLTGKKFSHYVALKKYIWLNHHFRSWKMNNDLIRAFTRFFDLSGLSNIELAKELIGTFFDGFTISVKSKEKPYVVFNWKNFILTQLISDLKSLVSHPSRVDDDWYEAVITSVKSCNNPSISQTKVGGAHEGYDLGKEFLRGCIYEGIISLEKFLATYPMEAENISAPLITHEIEKLSQTDSLTADFRSKLENVNTEFTSFEESKLIEYFQALPSTNFRFSKVKQQKLASLMEDFISKLIQEKNNEKLSWVALILSNVPAIANYIFYQNSTGPWSFLTNTINYIDGEPFHVDEDDGNFQDMYASFGLILTGVISVATLFGIDFSSITVKSSYAIDFINQFFFRSCDTLTNSFNGIIEQEKEIVSNYENLFTEWANALFDVNNDGLSDDLLKSVNVKQIYKFIFFLFRQAFTARAMGSLSENSLNNGIDYLSQNFLAPCSLEAMHWIASRIGPQQKSSDIMVEILLRIIEGNMGDIVSADSSGQKYTSRMILNTIGPYLMKKLKSFTGKQATENMKKLSKIISQETNAEYCQWDTCVTQPTKGSVLMSESIKNEVVGFLRETKTITSSMMSDTWQNISFMWNSVPTDEICYMLLQEIEQSLGARGSSVLEESKFVVDFFVFMLVCSPCADAEEVAAYVTNLEARKILKVSTSESDKEFHITINDHHSSIFNEDISADDGKPSPNEENARPRDELMGDFEMGDLFDDNFFDEPMTSFSKPNTSAGTPTGTQLPSDMVTIYKNSAIRISPLWSVSQIIISPVYESASRLIGVAQTRIKDELQKWRISHGY